MSPRKFQNVVSNSGALGTSLGCQRAPKVEQVLHGIGVEPLPGGDSCLPSWIKYLLLQAAGLDWTPLPGQRSMPVHRRAGKLSFSRRPRGPNNVLPQRPPVGRVKAQRGPARVPLMRSRLAGCLPGSASTGPASSGAGLSACGASWRGWSRSAPGRSTRGIAAHRKRVRQRGADTPVRAIIGSCSLSESSRSTRRCLSNSATRH